MNKQVAATADLARDICGELLEQLRGLGGYALPSNTPDDPTLRSSVSVQARDLVVCVRVLCPRPLRAHVLDRLGVWYSVLGRQTGSDGTSYLACALPLTADPSPDGLQTFTIAVS
jgi:hypothetical protein